MVNQWNKYIVKFLHVVSNKKSVSHFVIYFNELLSFAFLEMFININRWHLGGPWPQVALVVKNLPAKWETQV